MDVRPFKIEIPQAEIDDLRARLERTRWPDEIRGSGWDYGADIDCMKALVEYWRTEFDWRAQEKFLNEFHQFHASVGGINIHFIHERGKGPNPLPLIVTHGWPGSFAEMVKIVPLLSDPARYGGDARDSFDVIVPSMPGYGFSDRPTQRGMNYFRIAELWVSLMEGLGYPRFAAQGGDWGARVATRLGFHFSDRLVGVHLHNIPVSIEPYLGPEVRGLTENEQKSLEESRRWYETEGAYSHLQSTRPQSLSYGLNDSPAALAAWIVEKFRDWSDCDGDVERRFTKDELLTNVAIYWFTQTIHSSMRLYFESTDARMRFGQGDFIGVPCGVIRFAKEAPFPAREWVERCYNVQRWTEIPKGGHFAPLEEPEILVEDIREFFRTLR